MKAGGFSWIFCSFRAYDIDMKRSYLVCVVAVVVLFVSAVGLCMRALFLPTSVFAGGNAPIKIVLDAGHGGIDGGVTGITTGVKESDLNLAITLRLKQTLDDMGFETVLTRKTEAGLYDAATEGFKRRDMQRRKEIVQKADPTLLISVHQNRYPSSSVRGAQVFFRRGDFGGERLAFALQEKLNGLYQTEGVKSRKHTPSEYFMLTCTENPSVIVECGFLSSPADEKLLISTAWQKRLAESIAAGVVAYLAGELS